MVSALATALVAYALVGSREKSRAAVVRTPLLLSSSARSRNGSSSPERPVSSFAIISFRVSAFSWRQTPANHSRPHAGSRRRTRSNTASLCGSAPSSQMVPSSPDASLSCTHRHAGFRLEIQRPRSPRTGSNSLRGRLPSRATGKRLAGKRSPALRRRSRVSFKRDQLVSSCGSCGLVRRSPTNSAALAEQAGSVSQGAG